MVPQEVYDGVMKAIKAMKKLDAGESILPGSSDHEALLWAVLKVFDDNLIDHSPLTGEELAHAQKIADEYKAGIRKQRINKP